MIGRILTCIASIPYLGRELLKFRYGLQHPHKYYDPPDRWLRSITAEWFEATVVQIGSNDGVAGDPLHAIMVRRPRWRALLVEPVPHIFEELVVNKAGLPNVVCENVAISDGSEQTFYAVDPAAEQALPDLPEWYDQLGSFDRTHITKHLGGLLEPYIREIHVRGDTLQGLLDKHGFGCVDLLHVDTEGYDYEVFKQFDLGRYAPKVVLIEHKHLSTADKGRILDRLAGRYAAFQLKGDLLAVDEARVPPAAYAGNVGKRVRTAADLEPLSLWSK